MADCWCASCNLEWKMSILIDYGFGWLMGCPICSNKVLIMKEGLKRENYLITPIEKKLQEVNIKHL